MFHVFMCVFYAAAGAFFYFILEEPAMVPVATFLIGGNFALALQQATEKLADDKEDNWNHNQVDSGSVF